MKQLYSKCFLVMFLGLAFISFPLAHELVYSTYLGGMSYDEGIAITVDNAGNAYITGYTQSTSFPTTLGAFQRAFNISGTTHAFVSKLVIDNSPLAVEDAIWKSYGDLDVLNTQKR